MADPDVVNPDSQAALPVPSGGGGDRDPAHQEGGEVGRLRPSVPSAIAPRHSTTTRQVKRIAGAAIRHYQRVARHGDPATARTASVRHAVTVHAADARARVDGDGDPKPTATEVRAIAEATVGLYSGYVHEHRLTPGQAWTRTVQDVLGAWAPRGLSAAAWWLHEQIREEVGTRAQRAEIAVVLAAYNNDEGWLDRVAEYQAKAVDAAIQHDALRSTRRLRGQVAAAVQLLKQRPPDQAPKLREAQEVVAKLRNLQTVLERRPLVPGGKDPTIDYEHGLAQVAERLRAANRQVAELEAAQRLGREWDDAQAFELARAEAAALALRARELALTARLEAYRPPWLRIAVGSMPTDPTLRARWRRGVLAVLRWRVDHDVVDQTRALGPEPTDPAELRRYKQAVQHLSGIARSIGHTPVLARDPDRTNRASRQPGEAERPPPALPGRPEIVLGRDAGEEIGIDLP
jgi:hypothetical protein